MAKAYAYRMMDASRVYHRLEESRQFGDSVMPSSEYQCRYLAESQHNGKRLLGQKERLVKVLADIQTQYGPKLPEIDD